MPDTALLIAAADIARLRKLCADLEAIIGGWRPSAADLNDAPLITTWRHAVVLSPDPVLTGTVTRHPRIAEGRPTLTSPLYAIDAQAGWARTLSRFYRLGRAGGEGLQ